MLKLPTVLITGASGGIGMALAREFKSCNLVLQYHKNKVEFPGAKIIECDLRSEQQVAQMFSAAGDVDILINNAGISETVLFDQITLSQWNNMIAVNLTSAFLTCRAAVPAMINKKSGVIINIASIWGQVGASCEVHYSAAKGGLIAMSKALAKELAPSGIRVNCLSPGFIDTKMNAALSPDERDSFLGEIPLQRAGTPEEVALAAKFIAECTYMTGQVIGINGGEVV